MISQSWRVNTAQNFAWRDGWAVDEPRGVFVVTMDLGSWMACCLIACLDPSASSVDEGHELHGRRLRLAAGKRAPS